jgi:hypothetical protein
VQEVVPHLVCKLRVIIAHLSPILIGAWGTWSLFGIWLVTGKSPLLDTIPTATNVCPRDSYAFIAACDKTKTGRLSKCKRGMKSYSGTSVGWLFSG